MSALSVNRHRDHDYGVLNLNFEVLDFEPPAADDKRAIVGWLTGETPTPPARLLYDARGASLFEAICDTPEYYLTGKEESLLPQLAQALNVATQPGSQIVEYGSGSRRKIEQLLLSCPNIQAHAPIDISKAHLHENVEALAAAFPNHYFSGICADFFQTINLPTCPGGMPVSQNVGFFPGSTIGNMPPQTATHLLTLAKRSLGQGSLFVLGVDRVKPVDVLVNAYLDKAGASARFSLNLIDRINREMAGSLDKTGFRYHAEYNKRTQAIEMWWIATKAQHASVAGVPIKIREGQRLLVEISRKFTPESVAQLAFSAGYRLRHMISTDDDWYSLAILES